VLPYNEYTGLVTVSGWCRCRLYCGRFRSASCLYTVLSQTWITSPLELL